MAKKLNVLIVDDSATIRQMLTFAVNSTDDMQVAGTASDGVQALEMAQSLRPDVILMDAVMPRMNGIEATREIMSASPTPIIMISSSKIVAETDFALKAISAGALTLVPKPRGLPPSPQVDELLQTIRLMADVQVIHHWKRGARDHRAIQSLKQSPQIAGMVASTGGPAAISTIIRRLPADFDLPVVIVQHIAADFVNAFVSWLATMTKLRVEIARDGISPQRGALYLAPGHSHLSISPQRRFELSEPLDDKLHIPSGDVLLRSLASAYGAASIGIVLTGMGSDGAQGLKAIHEAGGFTIAQDEDSCVVFGMPREAITLGAVSAVLPLDEIGEALTQVARRDAV